MSTVLWANQRLDGAVTSDASDKAALYRHAGKLDALCEAAGVRPISSFTDTTDLRCNLEEIDLPDGMASTNELMARDGAWIEAGEAVAILEALLRTVRTQRTRFGLLRNDHDAVVAELEETLAFARTAAERGADFNVCVVM